MQSKKYINFLFITNNDLIFHLDNEVLVNFYEVLNAANIFRKHIAILNASDVDWRDKKKFLLSFDY